MCHQPRIARPLMPLCLACLPHPCGAQVVRVPLREMGAIRPLPISLSSLSHFRGRGAAFPGDAVMTVCSQSREVTFIVSPSPPCC